MYTIVTCMNKQGYETFGKKFLESAEKYLSKEGIRLWVYGHDFDLPEGFKSLHDVDGYDQFQKTFKDYRGQTANGYVWEMDLIKWSHKTFAYIGAAYEIATSPELKEWPKLIWLDTDVLFNKPLTKEDLDNMLDPQASIAYLGRKVVPYSEGGFFYFNLANVDTMLFLQELKYTYVSGEILGYQQFQDQFAFTRILNRYARVENMKVQNLSPDCMTLDAMGTSPLAPFITHYKGNKKEQMIRKATDVKAERYQNLVLLADHFKAQTLLEVGTWNGGSAIRMAEGAFRHTDVVNYTGFDLFEDIDSETAKKEFHIKAPVLQSEVEERLKEYAEKKAAEGKTFNFTLIKGNTVDTLPKFMETYTSAIDLAYIDGGHSIETIRSDYENLKEARVIIFDDYFVEDSKGKCPDIETMGCNKLIMELKEKGVRGAVLPTKDIVATGGLTLQAVIINDDTLPDIPQSLLLTPIQIQPRDSVENEKILDNIEKNLELIKDYEWLTKGHLTRVPAIIVSGGWIDFKNLKREIRRFPKAPVICVKHSFPQLLQKGIIPDYCVILDPRPIDGISTHGVKRKDLFDKAGSVRTEFLVASMTEPDVTRYLLEKGAKVRGFHAFSNGIMDPSSTPERPVIHPDCKIPKGSVFVTGGTCSATRSIGMFHIMGFRFFKLFGFQCNVDEPTEEQRQEKIRNGSPKFMKIEHCGKAFWSTGELLALAQDLEKMFRHPHLEFEVEMFCGDSLAQDIYYKFMEDRNDKPYWEMLDGFTPAA